MKLFANRYIRTGFAALFALFIVLAMQLAGILTPVHEIDADDFNTIPGEEIICDITNKTTVRQQFVYKEDTLNSFSVRVATFAEQKKGNLFVVLTDTTKNEKIQKWKVKTESIGDGSFSTYILDKELNDVRNHTFEISFTSDVASGRAITLWKNTLNLYEGNLSYDGQNQNGQIVLAFNTVTSSSRINYVYAFTVIFIIVSFVFSLVHSKPWKKLKRTPSPLNKECLNKLNYKNAMGFVCTELVLFIVSILAEKSLSSSNIIQPNTIGAFNEYRFAFIFVCLSVVSVFVFARKSFAQKPEIVAFMLILGVGSLYAFALPSEVFVSWDEAIHYWRSVSLSHAVSGNANSAEFWLYQANGLNPENFKSISQLHNAQNLFQNMYQTGTSTPVDLSALSTVWIISYIPSAIALFVGRFLQFPYLITFYMGTFANLALYATLIYFAMRKIKSGKMIIFVIATLTTPMFLSARYSYDTWVTGFFILGMAYFLNAMQCDEKIDKTDLAVMLGSFFFGSFAKTIYFPILLCLLFLPKWKFQSEKQCVSFKISVLAASGALAVSMLLTNLLVPFAAMAIFYLLLRFCYFIMKKLTKKQIILIVVIAFAVIGAAGLYAAVNIVPNILGIGDTRGGAVNSAQQYIDILKNPLHYMKVLFNFLAKYYLASGWVTNVNSMAYLGASTINFVPVLLLFLVAITDKNRYDCWKDQWKVRTVTSILIIVDVCLIATALYVSFTPYGLETINGCQPRYLLPLFFPFLALIGSSKIQNKLNRKWYNATVMALSSSLLLINIWQLLIGLYY